MGEVETWSPRKKQKEVDFFFVRSAISAIDELGQSKAWTQLAEKLNEEKKIQCREQIKIPLEKWRDAAQQLSPAEIVSLIRFFTLAEMQVSGCRVDGNSPVVALAKVAKQKGNPLNKNLLLWIKEHSDNRFLPHGAI